MKFGLLSSFSVFFCCSLSVFSYAASLQMYPVTVNFCQGQVARPIYIKNTGSAPIGTQMRLYLWQQKNNNDVLIPTQDIISSPPIAAIPAGKQQLVRLIIPGNSKGHEQAYRLTVDELPDTKSNTSTSQVKFLLRYSIPVFLSCPETKTDISKIRASLDTSGATPRLFIKNTNTQHIKLSNVSLISAGKKLVINPGLMGYVLPGSEMSWFLPKGMNKGTSLSVTINDNETNKTINLTR